MYWSPILRDLDLSILTLYFHSTTSGRQILYFLPHYMYGTSLQIRWLETTQALFSAPYSFFKSFNIGNIAQHVNSLRLSPIYLIFRHL